VIFVTHFGTNVTIKHDKCPYRFKIFVNFNKLFIVFYNFLEFYKFRLVFPELQNLGNMQNKFKDKLRWKPEVRCHRSLLVRLV